MSLTASSSYAGRMVGNAEFSDDLRGNMVKGVPAASSFPSGGFDLTAVKASSVPASGLTTVSVVKMMPPGITGNCIYIEIKPDTPQS